MRPLHALLQEHAELVETTAAEIHSPTLRKPQGSTPQGPTPQAWWGAATSAFRTVQPDEAIRATEKQAVKTVADAVSIWFPWGAAARAGASSLLD